MSNGFELIGVDELFAAYENATGQTENPSISVLQLYKHLEKRFSIQDQATWTYIRTISEIIQKRSEDLTRTVEERTLLDSINSDITIQVIDTYTRIFHLKKELTLEIKNKHDAIHRPSTNARQH